MVGVAQSVEHLVVAQVVVGSSPITHPIYNENRAEVICPVIRSWLNHGNLAKTKF